MACILAASSAFPQTARDYLNRVADTYKHLKSFQVESEVERGRADQRRELKIGVTLYVSPPDKVRIETKDSGNIIRSVLIWNHGSVTEYTPWKREFFSAAGKISVTFDPDRGTGLGEMMYDTIANGVTKASIRGKQTLEIGKDKIPCVIVDAQYGPEKRITQFSFWIAENGLLLKRAVTFWDGKEFYTLESFVRALTVNEQIDDDLFEFHPPPGVRQVPPPTGPAILALRTK